MAAVGAAGYAAPECLDYLLKYIKAKGQAEVAKVSKGVKRATGKAKPKRR
jgi:hypothetical protein